MQNFRVFLHEFWLFGLKQAWACLFGGAFLALILATRLWYPADAALQRYDFLLFAALAIQAVLILARLERPEEAVVIAAFHAVGTAMEVFKTHIGSWAYPEASLLRIGAVPLFSGFMYSAVGSYIARASRLFDFRFSHYPRMRWTVLLAASIYVNFFTHHIMPDLHLPLFAWTAFLFRRTQIFFTVAKEPRSMPLLVGFLLVALFIWFGENIGCFSRVWIYPSQAHGFVMVSPEKLGAWYLLMIVSFVLVSLVHRPVLYRCGGHATAGVAESRVEKYSVIPGEPRSGEESGSMGQDVALDHGSPSLAALAGDDGTQQRGRNQIASDNPARRDVIAG